MWFVFNSVQLTEYTTYQADDMNFLNHHPLCENFDISLKGLDVSTEKTSSVRQWKDNRWATLILNDIQCHNKTVVGKLYYQSWCMEL